MEKCKGCGAESERHPVVGIGRSDEGELEAWPVCAQCHEDPTHRKVLLKCHFHYRADEAIGLATAQLTDKMSKDGKDIGVGS